jgi:LysR family transcriptional activator of nhaA
VADGVPKLVSYRLLEPALRIAEPVHLTIREDRTDRLLAALGAHELDIVFTDAPAGPGAPVRVFNHLLGECGVVLLARPALARPWRRRFPAGLDGAPFLLPAAGTMMRRGLDEWFQRVGVRPRAVGEFDDPALVKVFGQAGAGIFAAPSAIEREVRRQYGVARVGLVEGARERFYAISAERRLAHPAVVAICDTARARLFAPAARPARGRKAAAPPPGR